MFAAEVVALAPTVWWAFSTSEWVTLGSLLVAAVGATGLGSILSARNLRARQPMETRTVAAEEAEAAVRTIAAAMGRLEIEMASAQGQLQRCEDRHAEHARICPLRGEQWMSRSP